MSDWGLAFLVAAVGVAFLLAVRVLLRRLARIRPVDSAEGGPGKTDLLQEHDDAVLVVETGGRIRTINARARQMFHLQEGETPNLERMARKTRPADALVKLCAAEGQIRFVLDGLLVEGVSYQVTGANQTASVITLRHPQISSGLVDGSGSLGAQTLLTFTQLTQAIAASLNLEETLRAVLESVERLMPADYLQVAVWNAEGAEFIPYHLSGLPGMERTMELAETRIPVGKGLTGYLYQQREPVRSGDVTADANLHVLAEALPIPARSYMGLPLMVSSECVGTLELASLTLDAFRQEDFDLIRLLSGQAAVAVHNAMLYTAEQRRTAELTGLAQLTQAFSAVREPNALFARLVDSITPLLDVDIVGFLVYNEAHRLLEARVPFHGLPDPFVALFHAPIPVNSAAEKMLLEQDLLITENAAEDEQWQALGMQHLAQAASLRETVLVPLASGGHILGYLQASNHLVGRMPFTQAELHLMMIVANQAASIIENAALVQQSRQRAQRAEALRRITSLAGSSASLEEVLQYTVRELAHLLRADVGALFLLDQEHASLRLHRPSVFGELSALPERAAHLMVDDPQFHFTVAGSQRMQISGNLQPSLQPSGLEEGLGVGGPALVPFYQSMVRIWEIESFIAIPLLARSEGIGEIWFGSLTADFFEQGDAQMVATAAGQLASVVEQSYLRGQTDESLRRRVDQLTAINRISRELSTSLDLNYLLNLVYDEALRTTHADCGAILLFDLEGTASAAGPRVRFFVGDMPDAELSVLERRVLAQDAPQNITNFAQSEYNAPHPGIQSALLVPISYQQRIAGMISLHGRSANQFDVTTVEISQSLAVQAAVALSNALAYEEQTRRGALLKRELETLTRLIQVARVLKPNQSLPQSLTTIATAIQSATPFQVVMISICDPDTQQLERLVGVGLPPILWEEVRARKQPWRSVQQLLQPEFRVGEAYYIPEGRTPVIPSDVHVVGVFPSLDVRSSDAWHGNDLLLIPLYDSDRSVLGLISVDAPHDNRQPDRPTFEALEVFAAQTAIIVESYLRAGRLEHKVEHLDFERARLETALEHARKNLPVLLHKDLEQSVALRGLNQRIERIRASLEIAALANRQESERAVLRTLAGEMLTRFAMQTALIAEADASGSVNLLEVIGSLPSGANPQALFGQRNPLRQILQGEARTLADRSLILVANLESEAEWRGNTLLNALDARSMIGVPLAAGDNRMVGVLVIGQRALPAFLEEDRRVFAQLGYQVSVGLRNLQLLNETRRRLQEVNLLLDFSRKLGSLQPGEIFMGLLESLQQTLPQAQAGWVGLWQEKEQAILPQSAVGYASVNDLQNIWYGPNTTTGELTDTREILALRVFRSGQAERIAEVNFAQQYHLSANNLLRYRRATGGRLPVAVMVIPLRAGETVRGLIFLENFDTPGAFSEEDEALAGSFMRQTALAMENARLYLASEQRATQLQALTRVAGTITSSLQRDALIASLLDQLKLILPYDTATLWLREGSHLAVAAATGFADNDSRVNLSVAVEDSALFHEMIQTSAPIVVADLRSDPRFPSLMEPEYLSWLGIPLIYKDEVIGLIALEKRTADFYHADDVQAATTFAGQAAVSLENARLYEDSTARAAELDERSQRLALLNRLSNDLVASLDLNYVFDLTARQLLDALDANGVAAVMIAGLNRYSVQLEVPARDDTVPLLWTDVPLLERLQESQGIFQTSQASVEEDLRGLWETFFQIREVQSVLVAPLVSGSVLQGWFMVYRKDSYRYSPSEIELARTICNQSAIAIQNARLFTETRSLTEDLERRVEARTHELRREHQNSQTLLHIITELSTSLDMGLVLNRTLGVLNDSIGCEESLIILSQGSATQYRAGISLARVSENAASVERQIARWVIRTRQPILAGHVQEDARWDIPAQATITYQSVLAVPLVMGEEVLGALLLFHRVGDFFRQDQMNLMEATARQIGIALNNAELFNLIRDQSEHLGSMLREQQIEASRSRAILEAVADGVLVTDAQSRVTLFNVSAERILELRATQAIGKSLEYFSGLFGKVAVEWMQTIRAWSQAPSSFEHVETYAEQIDLENGRVVAVRLAPVFWRQEFLGTVSIFRDITHEVQVDRLKTEFVANVSHELRTPMTSIKGYVEIILMGAAGAVTDQQTHFLKIVRSNTERLAVLVNDLLDVSRIEAGRVSLNLQALDVREIAQEVLADIQRRALDEDKPMRFDLQAKSGLPFALGDAGRVRQVFANLVSNGYNYTPMDGCVTVRIQQVDSALQIDVQDTGIGIDRAAQQRIFERFYRGEDSLVLATAGTGLGLAIAKTLIEMHHGRIWFESSGTPGEGSTFSFTLPVVEREE